MELKDNTARIAEEISTYSSLVELERDCMQNMSVTANTRLSPGRRMTAPDGTHTFSWKIFGRYGIQMIVPTDERSGITHESDVIAAQLGFDVRNEDFIISNSPQGLSRTYLEGVYSPAQVKKALQALKEDGGGSNFRDTLLKSAIEIAKRLKHLGVRRIVGMAAERHPNAVHGRLPSETAQRSMNRLYEKHGFQRLTSEDRSREPWDVDYVLPVD